MMSHRNQFYNLQYGMDLSWRVGYKTVTNQFVAVKNGSRFLFWRKKILVSGDIQTDFDILIQKIDAFVKTQKISPESLDELDKAISRRTDSLQGRLTSFWSFFMFSSTKEKISNTIAKFEGIRESIKVKEAKLRGKLEPLPPDVVMPADIMKMILHLIPRKKAVRISRFYAQNLKVADYINQRKIDLSKQKGFREVWQKSFKGTVRIIHFLCKHGKDLRYLELTSPSFVMTNLALNRIFELCPNLISLSIPLIKNFVLTGSNKLPNLQTLKFTSHLLEEMTGKDLLAFKDLPNLRCLSLRGDVCFELSDIDKFLEEKPHFQDLHLTRYYSELSISYILKKEIESLTLDDLSGFRYLFMNPLKLKKLRVVKPFKDFLPILPQLENLESLELQDSVPTDFLPQLKKLTPLRRLTSLTLFRSPSVQQISEILDIWPNLQQLSLPNFSVNQELVSVLPKLQKLKLLKIKDPVSPEIHELLCTNLQKVTLAYQIHIKEYEY